MEKINRKYQSLLDVLDSLGSSIGRYEQAQQSSSIDELTKDERRDSSIKRFELAYELFWKYLKEYLFVEYGISIDSPKKVFRECYEQGLVSIENVQNMLNMVDDRNLTTHAYDEDMADELANKISAYHVLMRNISQTIVPQ